MCRKERPRNNRRGKEYANMQRKETAAANSHTSTDVCVAISNPSSLKKKKSNPSLADLHGTRASLQPLETWTSRITSFSY
jgi:hypothetical protein